MERKVREDKTLQKKESITSKTTPTFSNDDEEFEIDDDEQLSLLVKNIWKMFYKRRGFNSHKDRWQGKEDRRNEIGPSYNYKKSGHLIEDCPKMKGKTLKSKRPYKRKAMKVIWYFESEFDEDIDTSNACLMA